MKRSGRCLCGSVVFTVDFPKLEVGACHCSMCLRWAGGPWLAVMIDGVTWERGEEEVRMVAASPIAERRFCGRCGTCLTYRLTAEGPYYGNSSVSFGALDDRSGFTFAKEWFIDNKPEAYAFHGERPRITEAEALGMLDD